MRILHDAHDADVVDLRKRGSDYEVAPAVAAAPVDRQLADAATANAPVVAPPAPVQRGMGSRGTGRGALGAKGAPPPNLLSVGVVGPRPGAVVPTPASAAPTNTAKPTGDDAAVVAVETAAAEKPARGRKRAAAKKSARKKSPSKTASASADKAPPAAKKRTARKKTAKTGSPDSAA
jgi:DNA topoisomerase-1